MNSYALCIMHSSAYEHYLRFLFFGLYSYDENLGLYQLLKTNNYVLLKQWFYRFEFLSYYQIISEGRTVDVNKLPQNILLQIISLYLITAMCAVYLYYNCFLAQSRKIEFSKRDRKEDMECCGHHKQNFHWTKLNR